MDRNRHPKPSILPSFADPAEWAVWRLSLILREIAGSPKTGEKKKELPHEGSSENRLIGMGKGGTDGGPGHGRRL
jgi:hypothetical protein